MTRLTNKDGYVPLKKGYQSVAPKKNIGAGYQGPTSNNVPTTKPSKRK